MQRNTETCQQKKGKGNTLNMFGKSQAFTQRVLLRNKKTPLSALTALYFTPLSIK